jgi:hypothetical protein
MDLRGSMYDAAGANCILRTFRTCSPCQIPLFKCQIKENELGRTCCMYEREERCIQSFGGET